MLNIICIYIAKDDEIERLKQNNENMKDDTNNDQVKQELVQVTAERDELQNTIAQLTPLFEEMTNKAAEKDEQCEQLKEDKAELDERIKTLEEEIEEQEQTNKTLKDTITELRGSLKHATSPSNENLLALNSRITEMEKLLGASQEKVDENDKLHKDISELTNLFGELQGKMKEKDETINKYESELEDLKLEYKEETQANESLKQSFAELETQYELLKLSKGVGAENEERIRKIKSETGLEMKQMQIDKDNLLEQLENVYEVINEELMYDPKVNKKNKSKSSRSLIKPIDNPDQVRKQIKKLKSRVDNKNDKIKELKFENKQMSQNVYESNHKPSPSLVDVGLSDDYDDSGSDIDVDNVLGKGDKPMEFKNLFAWLKDF